MRGNGASAADSSNGTVAKPACLEFRGERFEIGPDARPLLERGEQIRGDGLRARGPNAVAGDQVQGSVACAIRQSLRVARGPLFVIYLTDG